MTNKTIDNYHNDKHYSFITMEQTLLLIIMTNITIDNNDKQLLLIIMTNITTDNNDKHYY